MTTPRCPICHRIVALYKVQPLEPGTINPSGYDFNCEHCFYDFRGQPYLRFFGKCYYDMEFKSFVLRIPLQNAKGILMLEVLKDHCTVKAIKDGDTTIIMEEKESSLLPNAAQQYLLRIHKLLVFA